ncbi:MAG: ROK family protein, partial [Bacteroidales bacterium]|nr:ROK family protein [Bacteroidales bacterium]
EEFITIRAVRRSYSESCNIPFEQTPTPFDIFQIAKGIQKGNMEAAQKAFASLGRYLGDVLANLVTIFDGVIAIGGGVSGAKEFIIPAVEEELKHNFKTVSRTTQEVYCLNKEASLAKFLKPESKQIKVPFTNQTVEYSCTPKCAYVFSPFNTSQMISMGAYHFAKNMIEGNK